MSALERLPSAEQRRGERYGYARRAWCEHRDWTLYLRVGNLSEGGLFLHSSTPFAHGERLRVWVAEGILAEVEVRWSAPRGRSPGIGCSFSALLRGRDDFRALLAELAGASSRA